MNNDFECICHQNNSMLSYDMSVSLEKLIFLLQCALVFMIISNVVIVFSIIALCLGWA